MDQQELQENIAKYYSKLSPKMQEVFSSMKWLEKIKSLSEKYNLSPEEQETIGTETMLVLLGIISREEYESILSTKIISNGGIAEEILREIDAESAVDIKTELDSAFTANTQASTPEDKTREEELDKRFEKLPSEIQEIIKNLNYHELITNIGLNHKLKISQLVELEKITTDTMLGISPSEKFLQRIQEKIDIGEEKSRELAEEVKEKILKKVRTDMMSAYGRDKAPAYIAPAPSPEDKKVLSSAGIEILEEKDEKDKPANITPAKDLSLQKELPPPPSAPHPILSTKLTQPTQTVAKVTEHTEKPLASKSAPTSYPKGQDPYRLPPI